MSSPSYLMPTHWLRSVILCLRTRLSLTVKRSLTRVEPGSAGRHQTGGAAVTVSGPSRMSHSGHGYGSSQPSHAKGTAGGSPQLMRCKPRRTASTSWPLRPGSE